MLQSLQSITRVYFLRLGKLFLWDVDQENCSNFDKIYTDSHCIWGTNMQICRYFVYFWLITCDNDNIAWSHPTLAPTSDWLQQKLVNWTNCFLPTAVTTNYGPFFCFSFIHIKQYNCCHRGFIHYLLSLISLFNLKRFKI